MAAAPAHATAPACSAISNIAHADYAMGSAPVSLASNTASLRVEELLDLRLSAGIATRAVTQDALTPIPFTLVNTGNGQEAFLLDGRITGLAGVVEGFAIDADGNGEYDSAAEIRIGEGETTPVLASGASLQLFALVRGNARLGNGTLTVDARAVTGSGTPGTDFTGKGDSGGCDAVTGSTSAIASASVILTAAPGADTSQVQIVKSQTIVAPNGSSLTVKGSTITYTIESRFGGSGAVQDARIADSIPLGTAYTPGSMRLDGAALTDSVDADAGSFDGTSIHVALGTVAAPATRTISFQVKVQ